MSKGKARAEIRQGPKCARNTSERIARADMAYQRVLDTRANVKLGSTHGLSSRPCHCALRDEKVFCFVNSNALMSHTLVAPEGEGARTKRTVAV